LAGGNCNRFNDALERAAGKRARAADTVRTISRPAASAGSTQRAAAGPEAELIDCAGLIRFRREPIR